jgi:tail collar domain/collagen triple helix repeat protein
MTLTLSRRLIVGVAAAAIIGGGLAATGVALAAPATTSFAACVSQVGGVLYNVTTNGTPKCVAKDKTITWSQTGPTGPAGPAGPQGAAGAPGATGPQGAAGPDGTNGTDGVNGTNGTDGTNVLTSSGAPAGSCTTGDADIDITTGDVWKCDAGGWTATGSSITGPQGAPGPQGAAGPQGPAGPAGPAGTAAGFGTNTQQAQAGNGAECTLGQIFLSAGAVANGVPANGQILQISQNEAMFALLGTLYGGDGVTTFALPNLGAAAPNGLTYSICTVGVFPTRS